MNLTRSLDIKIKFAPTIVVFFFLLNSCSSIIPSGLKSLWDEDSEQQTKLKSQASAEILKIQPLLTFQHRSCPQSKFQIFSSNGANHLNFERLLPLPKGPKANFIDYTILWTLLQVMIRPDQVSQYAHFSMILSFNHQIYFLEFSPDYTNKTQSSFFSSLFILAKNFSSSYGPLAPLHLASHIDKTSSLRFVIDQSLGSFLTKNRSRLVAELENASYYFRYNRLLSTNEAMPRFMLKPLLSSPPNHQNFKNIGITQTDQKQENGINLQCNDNLHAGPALFQSAATDEHVYGIADQNGNYFIGRFYQDTLNFQIKANSPLIETPNSAFFATKNSPAPYNSVLKNFNQNPIYAKPTFCHLKAEGSQNEISIISSKTRSPTQLIAQLLKNKNHQGAQANIPFEDIKTPFDMLNALRRPRSMHLPNPERHLFELSLMSKEQKEILQDSPIIPYGVDKLGDLIVYLSSAKTFVLGPRSNHNITCIP